MYAPRLNFSALAWLAQHMPIVNRLWKEVFGRNFGKLEHEAKFVQNVDVLSRLVMYSGAFPVVRALSLFAGSNPRVGVAYDVRLHVGSPQMLQALLQDLQKAVRLGHLKEEPGNSAIFVGRLTIVCFGHFSLAPDLGKSVSEIFAAQELHLWSLKPELTQDGIRIFRATMQNNTPVAILALPAAAGHGLNRAIGFGLDSLPPDERHILAVVARQPFLTGLGWRVERAWHAGDSQPRLVIGSAASINNPNLAQIRAAFSEMLFLIRAANIESGPLH